jgi:hypothetical protein
MIIAVATAEVDTAAVDTVEAMEEAPVAVMAVAGSCSLFRRVVSLWFDSVWLCRSGRDNVCITKTAADWISDTEATEAGMAEAMAVLEEEDTAVEVVTA